MKESTKQTVYVFISEPGDATRYEYLLFPSGPDDYTIAPTYSSFQFPQFMSIYQALKVIPPDKPETAERQASRMALLNSLAEAQHCNPFTYLEVARSVVEVHRGNHG